MAVAVEVAPSTSAGKDPITISPKFSKIQTALSLAKDTGHAVNEVTCRCVLCGSFVGTSRSYSDLKGMLAMPCLGKPSSSLVQEVF